MEHPALPLHGQPLQQHTPGAHRIPGADQGDGVAKPEAPRGARQLDDTVEAEWHAAATVLWAAQRDAAEAALRHLLTSRQKSRKGLSFGVCRGCKHFRSGSDEHRCGLTGEPLSDDNSTRICREHNYPSLL